MVMLLESTVQIEMGRVDSVEIAVRKAGPPQLEGGGDGVRVKCVAEWGWGALVENNFHNIYLQNAIDGGIQSGILFALVLLATIKTALRSSGEHKVFGVALLAYAVTGFFQFVGYDVFGWLMIGICATLNSERRLMARRRRSLIARFATGGPDRTWPKQTA